MPAEARPVNRFKFDMVRNVAWGITVLHHLNSCKTHDLLFSGHYLPIANWTWMFFVVSDSESPSRINPLENFGNFASKPQDLLLDVLMCQQRHM